MIKQITKNKVFLETYGCQMNEYDSELIRSILLKANYSFVKSDAEADIIMLNTCAIRENAHRKIYGRIYDIRNDRRKRLNLPKNDARIDEFRGPLIGILGCMATNLRKELLEDRKLNIDFIAGPDSYKRLPQLIMECYKTDVEKPGSDTRPAKGGTRSESRLSDSECRDRIRPPKPFDVTLSEFETYSDIYPVREKGINAWIAVMRGCNNFCTFCVVPYTRGRERSRSPENVLDEVHKLADEGFKQVTLLGQNVNSYKYEDCDFAGLIEKVSKVDGIKRIRFTSPHPKDFPENLLRVVAENPKVCKNIHLPLQSGNDRILQLMDRIYTVSEYLALVERIRSLNPAISLTTDIIVGFPTETEAEFEDTLKIIRHVGYDAAFTFKYSQRKGTIAEKKFPDDIDEDVKIERLMRLVDLQRAIGLERNLATVGQTLEVVVEHEGSPKSPTEFQSRSDDNRTVIFPRTEHKMGDFLQVKITGATTSVLKGHVTGHQVTRTPVTSKSL